MPVNGSPFGIPTSSPSIIRAGYIVETTAVALQQCEAFKQHICLGMDTMRSVLISRSVAMDLCMLVVDGPSRVNSHRICRVVHWVWLSLAIMVMCCPIRDSYTPFNYWSYAACNMEWYRSMLRISDITKLDTKWPVRDKRFYIIWAHGRDSIEIRFNLLFRLEFICFFFCDVFKTVYRIKWNHFCD